MAIPNLYTILVDKTPFDETVEQKYMKKHLNGVKKPIWTLGQGKAKKCEASDFCNIEICVNVRGVAHTFQNVLKATKFLKQRDRRGNTDVAAVRID